MSEFEEFAEALFGQLEVELREEREIRRAAEGIAAEPELEFESVESVCDGIFADMKQRVEEFTGLPVDGNLKIEYPELDEFKSIKGRKVFGGADSAKFIGDLFEAVAAEDQGRVVGLMAADPARYLVYSTYAIQYISKITTTYGDYMDNTVFINRFVLSRYPGIILHKMGRPYRAGRPQVESGYRGAIKMTILEEMIHSVQEPLWQANRRAVEEVNGINERLAGIILDMEPEAASSLAGYLQLQAIPDEFPYARKASLFFFLNPDHFLTEQIGPEVMTYTHIEMDPRISAQLPPLLDIYKEWLPSIQRHHAAFTVMEGMAAYAVRSILERDEDFNRYLAMFMQTDATSYHVRKGMGMNFVEQVAGQLGRGAFDTLIGTPPTTAELKHPDRYIQRMT